jgi:peptidyl-tRNA hydrolase
MKKPKLSLKENKKIIFLDRYAGEWVAITNEKVVAHQGTLKKLMKRIRKLKRKPPVLLVPKKSEGPYIR